MMDPLAKQFVRYRDRGHLRALGAVFDALAPRLLPVAMHLCGNPADAEDALQQTFVLALQRAASFDAEQRLEPWLAGLLANVARNQRRHEGRRRAEELPDLVSEDEGPVAAAERKELVAQLRTHIDALPRRQRQVLMLQLQHGLTPAEIAEVLELAPGTVRMGLSRGLAALRRLLPATLAVLTCGVVAPRGLAAVRRAVLRAAKKEAITTVAIAGGGALVMKKLIAVFALVLCAGIVWSWANSAGAVIVPMSAAPAAEVMSAAAHEEGPAVAEDPVLPPPERTEFAAQAGALRVRVIAQLASGEQLPLGGAVLQAWPGDSPLMPFDERAKSATTDASGEVVLAGLPVGKWWAQIALDPRDEASDAVQLESGKETLLEITTASERIVRGVVVDPDGVPVAGAALWVQRGTYMGRYGIGEPGYMVSRCVGASGEDGTFAVAVMRMESAIGAFAAGYSPSFGQPTAPQGIDALRLVLGRGGATCTGTVRDAAGTPVAGALVVAEPAGQDERRAADGTLFLARPSPQVRTDANGRFGFEGLPPGKQRLWIHAEPHYPAWPEVELPAFGAAEVDVELKQGALVYGCVRQSDGRPARVGVAAKPSLERNGHFAECDTRADGTFVLSQLPRKFVVAVTRRGQLLASRAFDLAPSGVVRCDFDLPELQTVRGRVLDPEGKPLPAWNVRASDASGHKDFTTSLADGSFELSLAASGPLRVEALLPGPDSDRPVVKLDGVSLGTEGLELRVPADAVRAADTAEPVATVPASLTSELRVEITRADGEPWTGALPWVEVCDRDGRRAEREDEPMSGAVRVRVPAGHYRVTPSGDDLIVAAQEVDIAAGQTRTLRFKIAIGRTRALTCNSDGAIRPKSRALLHMIVRDAAGTVVAREDLKARQWWVTDYNYWQLDHPLPFGRYSVEAHTDDGVRYAGTFAVRENLDDPTRVDVPRLP